MDLSERDLFHPTDPNNVGVGEDCIMLYNPDMTIRLIDVECHTLARVMCEIRFSDNNQ